MSEMSTEHGKQSEDFNGEESEGKYMGGAWEAGCKDGGGHQRGIGGERCRKPGPISPSESYNLTR